MGNSPKLAGLAVVAALGLSACQSTSGACDQATPSGRIAATNLMIDCFATLNPTSVANMPTSGSATYNGYSTGSIETGPSSTDVLYSDATMTANFGTNAVSGSLTNFQSANAVSMSGTVNITGGTISGNTYTGGTIGGAPLNYGAGTLAISGTTSGVFMGDSAQGLLSTLSGTSTLSTNGHNAAATLIILGSQ